MTERPPRGDIEADSNGGSGGTGQDLRERREALGADLMEIAEMLCIRREFLEALEAGDYDALPGPAYAVGFVRTYAHHLGLDGEKLAGKFKLEISGETPVVKLDFPIPVQESRIPRGAIVLVTVLLAVAIYGVWYYMNARDLTLSDIVPEVPPLLGRTAEAPAPAPNVPAPAKDAVADSSAPGAAEPGATASPKGAGAVGDTGSASTAASNAASTPAVAMDSQAAAPPPTDAAPGPAPAEISPTAPADAAAPPPSAAMEAAAVPPPPPAPAAKAIVSTRIEIRARVDSWVQVRTKGGNLLVTRILSQGSSYAVPPMEGLRLTTGNAGGLKILVDGVVVPALGPFGAVRRDVVLDPERLKAGTAVAR